MQPRTFEGARTAESLPEVGDRAVVLAIAPTPFFGDYGCHVRILEEVRALKRRGVQTAVATYPFGRDLEEVRVHRATRFPGQKRIAPGSSRQKFALDASLALRALRAAAIERPVLVHGHLHEGALIGWLVAHTFRVPLIFDFQGSLTSEMIDHNFLAPASRAYRGFRKLEEWIVRRPDAIVTSTRSGAGLLLRDFGRSANVSVVPDAVDTGRFRPAWEIVGGDGHMARVEGLRSTLGIPRGRTIVVYLGLLAEYQGVTHLLKAAQLLANRGVPAHFLIMGFPGQDSYERTADALGLRDSVTFTGAVPYDRAHEYLALGDIAVSPKISETEGNGKILNYIAMGLPTVAFDTQASKEILGDLGVYARTGDWEDLADQIQGLIEDPDERVARGHQLREKAVTCHSWDQSVQALLEVYERAGAI